MTDTRPNVKNHLQQTIFHQLRMKKKAGKKPGIETGDEKEDSQAATHVYR